MFGISRVPRVSGQQSGVSGVQSSCIKTCPTGRPWLAQLGYCHMPEWGSEQSDGTKHVMWNKAVAMRYKLAE